MKIKYLTISILLLLCACGKSPNAPETGSLAGKVTLEGQTNHSGISVALYKLAELDTTILRYNREYPNVGFPISQATEFACPPFFGRDHRLGEVAAEAKTKQDGSFEIDGVEEGTYNLVAEKAGFGWKYLYPVSIFTPLDSKSRGIMNIQRGKHLTGQASNQNHPAPGDWSRLELEGADSTSTIEYTRISYAANGIMCKRAYPRIAKTCVRQSAETGFLIANESAAIIEHSHVFNSTVGIRVESGSAPILSYNLIANQSRETLFGTGVVSNASAAKIEDNVVIRFNTGIRAEYEGAAYVRHSILSVCETGMEILGSSFDLILNTIESCESGGINVTSSYPRIHNNNIIVRDNALYLVANGMHWPKPLNLELDNNYFGTTSSEEIGRRIIDKRTDVNGQVGDWRIIYEPIAMEAFSEAGPR